MYGSLFLTALVVHLLHGKTGATETEISAKWVTYATPSSMLLNPPSGAVRVGDMYIGRVPHKCGLWAGKVVSTGYIYVGLPNGSRLTFITEPLQVLVTGGDDYKWIEFDPSQGFPLPTGTVEAGYTDDGNITYVCDYLGRPGTYVLETDQCWFEAYGTQSGSTFNILVPKEASAEWVTYATASSLLQDPPSGAVRVGDLYIARVPHNSGVWVGMLGSNGVAYIGLPDGSGLRSSDALQVLLMEPGSYSWSSFNSTQKFPVPEQAVEAGYDEHMKTTYVCKYMDHPGTYVPETGRCGVESHSVTNSPVCEILHRD